MPLSRSTTQQKYDWPHPVVLGLVMQNWQNPQKLKQPMTLCVILAHQVHSTDTTKCSAWFQLKAHNGNFIGRLQSFWWKSFGNPKAISVQRWVNWRLRNKAEAYFTHYHQRLSILRNWTTFRALPCVVFYGQPHVAQMWIERLSPVEQSWPAQRLVRGTLKGHTVHCLFSLWQH